MRRVYAWFINESRIAEDRDKLSFIDAEKVAIKQEDHTLEYYATCVDGDVRYSLIPVLNKRRK